MSGKIIKNDVLVGLTDEQSRALLLATECQGLKQSTYCRQAIVLRLISEKFLEHPMAKYTAQANAKA